MAGCLLDLAGSEFDNDVPEIQTRGTPFGRVRTRMDVVADIIHCEDIRLLIRPGVANAELDVLDAGPVLEVISHVGSKYSTATAVEALDAEFGFLPQLVQHLEQFLCGHVIISGRQLIR